MQVPVLWVVGMLFPLCAYDFFGTGQGRGSHKKMGRGCVRETSFIASDLCRLRQMG